MNDWMSTGRLSSTSEYVTGGIDTDADTDTDAGGNSLPGKGRNRRSTRPAPRARPLVEGRFRAMLEDFDFAAGDARGDDARR
jgi:hypothetical protein